MELESIVEALRCEVKKGGDGDWGVVGEERDVDVALAGIDGDLNVVHGVRWF